MKKKQPDDLSTMRKQIKERQAEVRSRYPNHNWNCCLQHLAKTGHETALATLRSKTRTVQQTQNLGPTSYSVTQHQSAPKIASQLRDLLKRELALRMKESSWIMEPQKPDYTIDTKGTIIFKLSDGGTISDNGDETHFQPLRY